MISLERGFLESMDAEIFCVEEGGGMRMDWWVLMTEIRLEQISD